MTHRLRPLGLWVCLATASTALPAHDFESGGVEFSAGGVVAAAGQCDDNDCDGALSIQPEFSLRPGKPHELFVKFCFARGDVLYRRL